jgi:ankyrin repeat protein
MDWDEYLMDAIFDDDLSKVKEALSNGADPNARDNDGSALHWAAYGGELEMVKTLLEAGAKVEEQQGTDTALHAAVHSGNPEILRLLLNADGHAMINNFDIIEYTPLMITAQENRLDLARLLIEDGADVNANNEPKLGDTALKKAVENGSVEMVEFLLSAGADPTIWGWMGQSPLDQAQNNKSKEGQAILEMLEKAAAKLYPT